jgi:hypothetical protein
MKAKKKKTAEGIRITEVMENLNALQFSIWKVLNSDLTDISENIKLMREEYNKMENIYCFHEPQMG